MEKVKLGDVCLKITDGSHNPPNGVEYSEYLMLSSKNIFDGYITYDTPRYLKANDFKLENKRTQVQASDLLLTIVGTVGRVAIVTEDMPPFCLQRSVAVIKPNLQIIEPSFLMYQIQSMRAVLEQEAKGVAQKGIYLKQVADLPIVLLPLTEQKAIAEKLDKVSGLIEKRKAQLEKLDLLIKSRFVELFGDPILNDKQFNKQTGAKLFSFSSGKFLSEEKRKESGTPVYGGNGIAWYTDKALITHPTIVIGRVGAYCGNVRIIKEPVWITDNAIFIKEFKTDEYNIDFLYVLMAYLNFAQYADFSGQPKITQKPLENQQYIIPPIELQEEFALFVKQIDKSKLKIQKSLEKLEILKKSLMQQYFG